MHRGVDGDPAAASTQCLPHAAGQKAQDACNTVIVS